MSIEMTNRPTPPTPTESSGLDLNQVLRRTNQQLVRELQIHPDDPILALVTLNQELMSAYTTHIQACLKNAEHEIAALTRLEIEKAKDLTANMIERTGNHLEEQLKRVGEHWEAQLKQAATQELAALQQANQAAKIGGYCLLAAGVIVLAVITAQFILGMMGYKI